MTDLISAEHLYRYYGQHCAVNDVSFNLQQGQVLGLLGQNGAGKTTTMQILCGNLAPSSGTVHIQGIDLLSQPQAAKVNLGYLPDTPPLYKDLSVNEFLHYCAQLHRVPSTHISSAVHTAKTRCGLLDVAERLIGNLSKGYQQRVGIAQAIVHNPAVIILDEPTVGLDPIQIREIRSLIRELGTEHGIILSTHILSEVQESCTHVQIMHQGRLVLHASINELNQQMNAATLDIVTRAPADLETLRNIPGIVNIELLDPTTLRVHHQADRASSVTEQLTTTIVNAGWGLQSLTPSQYSLEDAFIRLTQPDSANL